MLRSDSLDTATETQFLGRTNAATEAPADRSLLLDWNRLLRHPRLEPLVRRMFPDQRRYERLTPPHLVGYLGRAHATRPFRIANISVGGFCMLIDENWTPGTELPITLQREDWDGEESTDCVTLQANVVRCEEAAVGFSIPLSTEEVGAFLDLPYDAFSLRRERFSISREKMEQFLCALSKPKPPRTLPISMPCEAPLTVAERTRRLIELAKAHRLSTTSELIHTES